MPGPALPPHGRVVYVPTICTRYPQGLETELVSVGNDTYGITGIPTTVAGRGIVRRAGLADSTKGDLPRFGPQRCVKPYDPALVDVFSVLELLN